MLGSDFILEELVMLIRQRNWYSQFPYKFCFIANTHSANCCVLFMNIAMSSWEPETDAEISPFTVCKLVIGHIE